MLMKVLMKGLKRDLSFKPLFLGTLIGHLLFTYVKFSYIMIICSLFVITLCLYTKGNVINENHHWVLQKDMMYPFLNGILLGLAIKLNFNH